MCHHHQFRSLMFAEEEYDYYYEDTLPRAQPGSLPCPPDPPGDRARPPRRGRAGRGQQHCSRSSGGSETPCTRQPSLTLLYSLPSLPLLTTKRPRKLRLPDTEAQREVIQEFGPFEEHFIAPPQINAGALPLALNEDLPLFPPFNKPKKSDDDRR